MSERSSAVPLGPASPVRALLELRRRPTDFPLHVWGARLDPEIEAQIPESAARFVACGVSGRRSRARRAAWGEGIERYAFVRSLEWLASSDPCEPDEVDPELVFRLPFLLPGSLDRARWSDAAARSSYRRVAAWPIDTCGHRLTDSPVRLPVQFLTSDGAFDLFSTTNGLACAMTFEEAARRAYAEVVERDALMLVWLLRAGGRLIDPREILPNGYVAMLDRMREIGVSTTLRGISTDAPHRILLAIVTNRAGSSVGPVIAFGAGSHTDPAESAIHAVNESAMAWKAAMWRTTLMRGDEREQGPATPRDFEAHSRYYLQPDRARHLDFLFEANSPEAGFAPYKDHVERTGYAIDVTPEEVRPIGAFVVRVVVPDLIPLYVGEWSAGTLLERRLPIAIGGRLVARPAEINVLPHPWP